MATQTPGVAEFWDARHARITEGVRYAGYNPIGENLHRSQETLHECPACGALVSEPSAELHGEWHLALEATR